MSYQNPKSRENWLVPFCIKDCANKGKRCDKCLRFSEYKANATKTHT